MFFHDFHVRICRASGAFCRRYGHESIVAGVPLVVDFHLEVFVISAVVVVALFVYEMAKDGVL